MNVKFNGITHTVTGCFLAINGNCAALRSHSLGHLDCRGFFICRHFLLIFSRRLRSIFRIFRYISCCCCHVHDGRSQICFFYCVSISYFLLFSNVQCSDIKAVIFCQYNTFQTISKFNIHKPNITSILYRYLISNHIMQRCLSRYIFYCTILCNNRCHVLGYFQLRIFHSIFCSATFAWFFRIFRIPSNNCITDNISFICFLYQIIIFNYHRFCFFSIISFCR